MKSHFPIEVFTSFVTQIALGYIWKLFFLKWRGFIVRLRRTFNNHSNINHHSTKYHKEWDWSNNVLRFVCSKMIFFFFFVLFYFLFLRLFFISSSFLLIFLWLWDLFCCCFFYYQREILIRQQQSESREILKKFKEVFCFYC